MTLPGSSDPREFGEAIRRLRESKGISLDLIVERTKISRRMLDSLEDGSFERLPGATFGRMFLKQYLELLDEPVEPWLAAFAVAWRRHEAASGSVPALVHDVPVRRARVTPWLLGVALVVIAFVALAVLQHRRSPGVSSPAPTPDTLLTMVTPPPAPTPEPSPTAAPAPPATPLVISTGERDCWVEVHQAGRPTEVRLLGPRQTWEVPVGEGPVDLVLGDAGTARVVFHGEERGELGKPGEVVHVHLAVPSPTPAASPAP
jgi:cytoskeleton protein RodZ